MRRRLRVSLILSCALAWSLPRAHSHTDTIRYLHYNLLNYGNSNAANRPSVKNQWLSAILQYVQPDLFSVNEVFSDSTLRDSLLLALGSGWQKTTYSNQGNATQTNSLFFKHSIFELRSQSVISANLRDIIAYRFRYRDTITHPHDTVFLTVIVCHFKSSDGSADEAERAVEAGTIANYLNAQGAGNYILAGDMNVYYSAEPAYQTLVSNANLSARLYDPINRPGYWHDDPSFADIHTQSPRNSNLGDGGVAGGLDDRFDQILVSGQVISDAAGIKYLPRSYTAIGQDGLHFNAAVIDAPANLSAPPNVIQALHLASDHLPIMADFILHTNMLPLSLRPEVGSRLGSIRVVNPVRNRIELHFPSDMIGSTVTIMLHSVIGQSLTTLVIPVHRSIELVDFPQHTSSNAGLFVLTVRDESGNTTRIKLIKH